MDDMPNSKPDVDQRPQQTTRSLIKLIFVLFFLLSAALPLILSIAGIDSQRFASEALPVRPVLVENGKINTLVTTEFDTYWSRTFPLNSFLVSRYNWLTGHLLSSSSNDKVIWARDGYMFFGETLHDILKVTTLDDNDMAKIRTSLRLQGDYVARQAGDFYFTLAPNKASLYSNKLPRILSPSGDESNSERFLSSDSSYPVIDLFTPLRRYAASSAETIYHRLDSHWNGLGAYEAYKVLMTEIGFTPLELSEPFTVVTDFQGDLATMFYPDRQTLDVNYLADDLMAGFLLLRPIRTMEDITIETRQESGTGSLVMYRDSFANALIPYISSCVHDVTYLNQSQPDYRVVEAKKPDKVLYQIVERNLDWLLQMTPIMPAPSVQSPETSLATPFEPEIEQSEAFGYHHINGRLDALEIDFTRVIVASGDDAYEAFPIFQDCVVDDHHFVSGFSLYTPEQLNDISIYVLTNKGWCLLGA